MVRAELPSMLGKMDSPRRASDVTGTPKLTPKQIFTNKDSRGLTVFGSKLQGVLNKEDSVNDPRMTSARTSEVNEEIDKICQEIRVSRKDLPFLRALMLSYFQKREELIKKRYPLS